MSITLTGKEILDLARYAGYDISGSYSDLNETEYTIHNSKDCDIGTEDGGTLERFAHVAMLSEYPEEGCFPLGDKITAQPEEITERSRQTDLDD